MKITKDKITTVRYSTKLLELLKESKPDLTIQKIVDLFFEKEIEIVLKPRGKDEKTHD